MALGLLDTVTVSLTVLVVVGMAARKIRSSAYSPLPPARFGQVNGVDSLTSWTWPWRRRAGLEDADAATPTAGAPPLLCGRGKLSGLWLKNYAVEMSAWRNAHCPCVS